jgi:hypothetical protein
MRRPEVAKKWTRLDLCDNGQNEPVPYHFDSEPFNAQPLGAGRTSFRGGIGRPLSATEVLGAVADVAPALA